MLASAATVAAVGALLTPSGGFHAHAPRAAGAPFTAGAAVTSITAPLRGHAGHDPADCDPTGAYSGPRQFAFEEPYIDQNHNRHYDSGEPYLDCNGNGRWEGTLIGGGNQTPRFATRVADPAQARAVVVGNGRRRIAVEVLDQEGLFNVYQQQIRAKVAADGVKLSGIFISATHDESAPDSLGLGGVNQFTSGVDTFWTPYMVAQAARAIELAARSARPAHLRFTEVLEPSNLRQCWSSYPFVDDQHMPVLEAVDRRGHGIATLADVSQHAETLGFNQGQPGLFDQGNWISADWVHFLRSGLERRLGGVAIEMAGAVGSVESPEAYPRAISRVPQIELGADHPAGCRTLFRVGSAEDLKGTGHVPLGYLGESRAWGEGMAAVIAGALRSGRYQPSRTNVIWGRRADICVPLQNQLFVLGASLGVFAARPGYNADCTTAAPVLPSGSSAGESLRSQVAAFRIGDGEFISVPGEVFPFTYLRGSLGPQDMPDPRPTLPPWLLPHMHTPFRFIDGLGEDMIGYMFPAGNAVGIPTSDNLSPSDHDRFGCNHSDDGEAASAQSADIAGRALQGLLDAAGGQPETVVRGRYLLPGGKLSRSPLGGPGELGCTTNTTFAAARRPAAAVMLAGGRQVRPAVWMSLSGLPQRRPDRDTRGYFDRRGRRVWLDVYPDL